MVSSKGYGGSWQHVLADVDFNPVGTTQWRALVSNGELNYYFIGGNTPADALNRYGQIVGTPAPVAPRFGHGIHAVEVMGIATGRRCTRQ